VSPLSNFTKKHGDTGDCPLWNIENLFSISNLESRIILFPATAKEASRGIHPAVFLRRPQATHGSSRNVSETPHTRVHLRGASAFHFQSRVGISTEAQWDGKSTASVNCRASVALPTCLGPDRTGVKRRDSERRLNIRTKYVLNI